MNALDAGVVGGMLGSLGTGIATAFGALPILGIGRPTARRQAVLLAFAAGVMLAAAFFSLVLPALAHAERQGLGRTGATVIVVVALLAGAGLMEAVNLVVPGADRPAYRAPFADRAVWLLVLAITLHNIPEGAAVGLSFVDGGRAAGVTTAIGIGVQDLPEGFAVASALAAIGWSRRWSFAGGVASGVVEPIAGAAAALLVGSVRLLLPWGLAAAAGAMLMIVVGHILPATITGAQRGPALVAFFLGLALMMALDTALA